MSLRSKLIRLAHENPDLREHLLPILTAGAEPQQKTALAKDTEAFVAWALARDDAWSENQFKTFLEKVTGWEPQVPAEAGPSTRRTGPLEEGEKVICDRYRNANEKNVDECEKYHDMVGFVKSKTTEGLVIQFYRKDTDEPNPGAVALFDGFTSGKGTGLYRWTPKPDIQEGSGKTLIEVVYLRGGQTPPPQRDIDQLKEYIESGLARGEQRTEVYYSGFIAKFAYNKEGKLYALLSVQQRDRPTTLSPTVGRVLYMGVAGKRPGGWKADWERMNPEAAAALDAP